MAHVFILGAGFSKALSSHMPLTSGLAQDVLSFWGQSRSPHAEDVEELKRILGPDVEQWLSLLGGEQPWSDKATVLRDRALFEDLLDRVKYVVTESERMAWGRESGVEIAEWFTPLVRYWHDTGAVVISLNYDTLVERHAAATLTTRHNETDYPLSPQMLYCRPIPHVNSRFGAAVGSERVDTFTLLKLHGSINWLREPSDIAGVGETYLAALDSSDLWNTGEPGPLAGAGLAPVIVPPTMAKSVHFADPLLRQQWRIASRALQSASRVFVLGCSLRSADWDFCHLLQTRLATRSGCVPYSVDIGLDGDERLRELLKPSLVDQDAMDARVSDTFAGEADAIAQLVSVLQAEGQAEDG